MKLHHLTALLLAAGLLTPVLAVPTITGTALDASAVNDRSRKATSVTMTVTAATTATLDGQPFPIGTATLINTIGFHEIVASDGTTTVTRRFIVRNPERLSTEDGIPTMRPYRFVNDAPSAFAAGVLTVMAPSTYPKNLPVPVAARLTKGASFGAQAGDPLFLNGLVVAPSAPSSALQLKRGWGSTILPAATTDGTLVYDATVGPLAAPKNIVVEPSTTYVTKGGTISSAENWGANARIYVTSNVVVGAGGSLTIGAGTIVRCAPGVEFWIRPGGSTQINGTVADPVVFVPDSTSALWGGFWLQPASGGNIAQLTATGTIFCCWGANQNWFATAPSGEPTKSFPHHRNMQPLAATASGAISNLTDCALIGPTGLSQTRGAGFATNGGTLRLTRVLCQRCITGGEQEDSPNFLIESSAILEMTEPGLDVDDTGFADADNDAIYLVPRGRTFVVNKSVIGWTKDDGIDTGGDGNGFTICTGCWFENCVHEAISNSGVNRVPETHEGVHFNCGQGMECGYGGPLSLVDHSLMIGNMVGARYGDNYGSDSGSNGSGTSQYDGTMTVQNGALCLYNYFHDVWGYDFSRWDKALGATRVVMKNSRATNAGDLATQTGPEDSGNALWNPATEGALIAPFMPVPDSNVGVDILSTKRIDSTPNYPGTFTVRLSTFSSKSVSVGWQVVGKASPDVAGGTVVGSGTLTYLPGETLKTVTAPALPGGNTFGVVEVSLTDPSHAEVTGSPLFYFSASALPPDIALVSRSATGWSYHAVLPTAPFNHDTTPWPPLDVNNRRWTSQDFVESATWQKNKAAPLGFGSLSGGIVAATTFAERPVTAYFRKTFTVATVPDVKSMTLECAADDGAAVYLNGVKISPDWGVVAPGTRPGGEIFYDDLSSRYSDGNAESTYYAHTLTGAAVPALLASPAVNVLSVEVHQQTTGSGDLVMDASLSVAQNPAVGGGFGVTTSGDTTYLYWISGAQVLETSTDLASWVAHPEAKSPVAIRLPLNRMFYRLRN